MDKKYILPKQKHTTNIVNISTGEENVENCDGLITKENNIVLISYSSDCATIAIWDKEKVSVLHAGWRGFVNGIVEKMRLNFQNEANCFIAPFLHKFEIQKDECYFKLKEKFSTKYFTKKDNKIFFDFRGAVLDSLSGLTIELDERSTIEHLDLASWRRDSKKGDGTQNRLVVWKENNEPKIKFFPPGVKIKPV